jgi:hypothetical protein
MGVRRLFFGSACSDFFDAAPPSERASRRVRSISVDAAPPSEWASCCASQTSSYDARAHSDRES